MNFPTFKTLLVDHKENIVKVTLNRPEVRNAINFVMMQELLSLWQQVSLQAQEIHCIVLTGQGSAFSAGADLKARLHLSLSEWQEQYAVLQQAMLSMLDCPIPIIAAVNGAAFGGGLELALACDFIYASENATFAQSEVKMGIMPGALGTQHLPRAVGLRRAKELAFTAEPFSAKDAFQWGMINQICLSERLLIEVNEVALKIKQNAPLSVKQVKKAMNMSQQLDLKSGYAFEVEAYHRLLFTEDRAEGIRAFNEKRKPEFIGK